MRPWWDRDPALRRDEEMLTKLREACANGIRMEVEFVTDKGTMVKSGPVERVSVCGSFVIVAGWHIPIQRLRACKHLEPTTRR